MSESLTAARWLDHLEDIKENSSRKSLAQSFRLCIDSLVEAEARIKALEVALEAAKAMGPGCTIIGCTCPSALAWERFQECLRNKGGADMQPPAPS